MASAALALATWPVAPLSAGRAILVPVCGGGFHPLPLPDPDNPDGSNSGQACHSANLRKRSAPEAGNKGMPE